MKVLKWIMLPWTDNLILQENGETIKQFRRIASPPTLEEAIEYLAWRGEISILKDLFNDRIVYEET